MQILSGHGENFMRTLLARISTIELPILPSIDKVVSLASVIGMVFLGVLITQVRVFLFAK